jgi:hypothetical protein
MEGGLTVRSLQKSQGQQSFIQKSWVRTNISTVPTTHADWLSSHLFNRALLGVLARLTGRLELVLKELESNRLLGAGAESVLRSLYLHLLRLRLLGFLGRHFD